MKYHCLLSLRKACATAFLLAMSTGAVMAVQEIAVEDVPFTTSIVDNSTIVALGSVEVGSPPSGVINKTFRIRNVGTTDSLALSGSPRVQITGGDAALFSVTAQPSASVTPASFTDFTIRFAPTSEGSKTTTLIIANNDSDENPFRIKLLATATAPEIKVDQGSDNDVTSVDFGSEDLGTPTRETSDRVFKITNTGDATLNLTYAGLGTEFTFVGGPPGSIAPGNSANFTVRFSPTSPGAKLVTLNIGNNDPDGSENPYAIALSGTATQAVMVIEQQPAGTLVANNATINFGTISKGFTNDLTFTVKNTGNATLNLTSFAIGGVDIRAFNFVGTPPASVDAGLSDSFTVRFGPSEVQSFAANLTIANNSATTPFTLFLTGTGLPNATFEDAFGYKLTEIAGGNILPFLVEGQAGVVKEATLTGIDKFIPIDIGFNFFFYETAYTRCSISTTGLITFGGSTADYTPDDIPNANAPDNFIAPLWTDLQVTDTSRILYKTDGTAPNRVFIVKYENVKLYNNNPNQSPDKRVTFQVQLYETTNAIQVRYEDVNPAVAFPGQALTVGIESRDYGTVNPQPGVGIVGIRYKNGLFDTNRPWRPTAFSTANSGSILFTRPVVTTVESKYAKPTPTVANPTATTPTNVGSLALGLNPDIGTIYRTAIGTVKRFEAPEFIYLNRNFEELPQAGEVDAPDTTRAWYRLVNDGYALDGQVVQGTQLFFTTTLTRDVTVVWRWRLEYAATIESATGQGGFGNPTPTVGRQWYKLGDQFTASVDSAIEAPGAGLRFRTVGYTLYDKNGGLLSPGIVFPNDAASRRAVPPRTIIEPFRLVWNFTGQVRYRFDAAAAETPNASLTGQSFVRVYQADRTTVDTTVYGSTLNTDVWIDSGTTTGRKVEVGAFYRSSDQLLTLGNLGAPPGGDLVAIQSVDVLNDTVSIPDQQGQTRVSRTFTVRNANAPAEIHWVYQPTIFRAEVPLGQSLDGFNGSNQLVPIPPTTMVLKVSDTGPGNTITTKIFPPDGSFTSGDALRWDGVGKGLFPVRPGTYEIAWPDGNDPGKKYKVEIITGYPGDTVTRATPREDINGARVREGVASLTGCATTDASITATCASTSGLLIGMNIRGPNIATGATIAAVTNATTFTLSSPATGTGTGLTLSAWKNYQTTVILPEIDPKAGFPAQAEQAHYRHLFDPVVARQAPTLLDLSASDEWKFQDLTFADTPTKAAANKAATSVPFTALDAGRSVVLFSYRSNPDEIADGNLTQENLAVRVVRSSPVSVIPRNDPKLVLGHRALGLGSGTRGIVQTGGTPVTAAVVPGSRFVVDFWLNAKGLQAPAAVVLTNCITVGGSTNVTCASTATVVPGMNLSGTTLPAGTKIASIVNGTTLVLNTPASANGNALSITASNKPVTVVSTGNGGLKVTLDEAASTVTAGYRGAQVTHQMSKSGVAWRHYAVHVFDYTFFGVGTTVVDFYLDGVRKERGFVSSWFPGTADSAVGTTVTDNSLRFGVDAEPRSGLQLDNFRFFSLGSDPLGYLSPSEVLQLRSERDKTPIAKRLRGISPQLSFDFETAPTSGRFANQGTLANVGVGTVTSPAPYADTWTDTDLQEVATQLSSTLDNAGFAGSGYILNAVSNYNPNLYNRDAQVGTWGPIFPVNHSQLFTATAKKLEVAYYENPYLTDPVPHPNVAWPYVVTEFKDVVFPTVGPNKDKAIYIASRIGSEGVSKTGYPQNVYDLARYSDLKIYQQPNPALAGYNPNEEHALTAPSGRAALKVKNLGESVANNPPLAAFALQQDLNNKPTYTSEPWVLVQVNNLGTGEPEMAAYRVFDKRTGAVPFPRPADSQVGGATGLAYEPAANPENRFLTLAAATAFDFSYQFEYPVFAGDLLVPPYPLNLVIGNASMADERGGNIQVNAVNQRTLWRDASMHAWVVSGGGKFFEQFFYPMRADFYLPGAAVGKPVAWLPAAATTLSAFLGDDKAGTTTLDDDPKPVKVRYSSAWRTDYPKLKRGETLAYQGGEYFSENPGSQGLPAVVAMKAAEIVYDSATPAMVIGATTTTELNKASARIIRPLDRREHRFTNAQMIAAGLVPGDPASSKVIVVAERWYFKDLSGSLQKRFYFDSLAETLVFRGRLNDKEGGDPKLTSGPDPINALEPNVMTLADYKQTAPEIGIRDLSADPTWTSTIDAIFLKSQNPNGVTTPAASLGTPVFLQGVKPVPPANTITAAEKALVDEQKTFWKPDLSNPVTGPEPKLLPLDSFGVGSALVPNASLLTQTPTGSLYVTLAENNRAELNGAPVSLHIIEIIPDRYRGAIKVIEGSDAFSERITLQHNGEFGANTGDLDYEWWIRDARELDDTLKSEIGSLTTSLPSPNWQLYANGANLHTIVFQGRPDVVLADKLVLMRYRHKNETKGWKLVPFELPTGQTAATAWQPGSSSTNAPFQWAGAANSPQLQADGSKRYIPQLVMGWVKRVLDRINPYEARYTDFFSNESPASYSSQIQIAGAPYAGNVALNPDKNVIENTGLIELYRTVLARAENLSIKNSSNGNASDGINQALLLAATRLSVLYELLAREAYSDAQDPTISVAGNEPGGLASVASYTHAFQNMEPDLLHEELSLLRGTDFRKSYPVYNRIFWNYAKGLGEAAYNSNYNIYDANTDGFINENDARILYPQGHGDAWGHFLSAVEMHYLLLQEPNFSWKARSELYSLMQNVIPVDFLDEKTFARLAAGKARAGRDIVRATYRLNFTNNPDGQWQGYTDGGDKARAWGVSEWARRAGQGAYFDWAVANAMLPERAVDAAGKPLENLAEIERSGAEDEIGGVAAGLHEIQVAMDEANTGSNPLGFSSDAIAFDIDPTLLYVGSTSQVGTKAVQGLTHFEQIYERAVISGRNAAEVLKVATEANNKLRLVADSTEQIIVDSLRQDLDYRNRLIEIFGRPYAGQIGFGKSYPEGYEGPDTLLYAYLDKTRIDQIVPSNSSTDPKTVTFTTVYETVKGLTNDPTMVSLYSSVFGSDGTAKLKKTFETIVGDSLYQGEASTLTLPYNTASKYALQAPTEWGQRTSYGRAQTALGEMLAAEIALDAALADYIGFLQDWEQKLHNIQGALEVIAAKNGMDQKIVAIRATINATIVAVDAAIAIAELITGVISTTSASIEKALPLVTGIFDYDVTSIARGIAFAAHKATDKAMEVAKTSRDVGKSIAELLRDELIAKYELDKGFADSVATLHGLVADLEYHSGGDQPKRDAIGAATQELELKRQDYTTSLAEGFRLLREREAFNKVLAAKSQKNRYQDMIMRLTRNEAMAKYQSAFNLAARYTWLSAKAYDYETSLDPSDPAAVTQMFDQIIKERQLGQWGDGSGLGDPKPGKGGLAELLSTLKGNFDAIEGQIGLNHIQVAYEGMSLRAENFRIGPPLDPAIQEALDTPSADRTSAQVKLVADNQSTINEAAASTQRWKDTLKGNVVDDLWQVPEFRLHCRPFADPSAGKQPGVVIRFSGNIEPGQNYFGRPLVGGDHAYSSSQFATRVAVAGVVLKGYPATDPATGLATTPRAYLIPVGTDYCRVSNSQNPLTRSWSVKDARIPTPYVINQSQINSPGFIPRLDGIDGSFGDVRRHADFRMFHEADGEHAAEDDNNSTRLMARSVWNSQWLLIIPGAGLYYDSTEGVKRFTESVSDIMLNFKTYSHNGQ